MEELTNAITAPVDQEVSLLMKIQAAGKDWNDAPEEFTILRELLAQCGYENSWSPKKLAVNLLTPNRTRGVVLRDVLMAIYPFDSFWVTETLEETLQKCLLVCQQLGINCERSDIWGQCSVESSYQFWLHILKIIPRENDSRKEEDIVNEAKSKVIAALTTTTGTDWDKRISGNFSGGLKNNQLSVFLANYHRSGTSGEKKPVQKTPIPGNWRSSFPHVFDKTQERDERSVADAPDSVLDDTSDQLTTTAFAIKLKLECEYMIDALKHIEKYYSNDSVLQIESAFKLGDSVCNLVDEFEGYMSVNNRGAFRDVESLINHTDRVVRALSKITETYQDFFLEFQKYFGTGKLDDVNIRLPLFPRQMDPNENK